MIRGASLGLAACVLASSALAQRPPLQEQAPLQAQPYSRVAPTYQPGGAPTWQPAGPPAYQPRTAQSPNIDGRVPGGAPLQGPAVEPSPGQSATNQPTGAPPTAAPPLGAPDERAEPVNTWLPAGAAKLQALDKVNAQASSLVVKVGQSATFGSLTITVKSCVIRPPDQPQDAAAYLDVTDSHPDSQGFNGWLLENEPSVSMMQHPIYDLRVTGCA